MLYCDPKTKFPLTPLELKNKKLEGIPVFFELDGTDEYEKGDPYSVELFSQFHQNRAIITVKLITEIIRKCVNCNVLDVGCGKGVLTNFYSQNFPNYTFYGLDYSYKAIKEGKKLFPHLELCVANVYELPYLENFFDIVIMNNLIEHLHNPSLAIYQIKRCLKKNGGLIISTPSRYRFENICRMVLRKKLKKMSPLHITEYTLSQIRELLQCMGFRVVRIESQFRPPSSFKGKILAVPHKFFQIILKQWGKHHILDQTVFYFAVNKK